MNRRAKRHMFIRNLFNLIRLMEAWIKVQVNICLHKIRLTTWMIYEGGIL
jgi:hypothetical protein